MKKKKLLTCILSASMVLGVSITAFASVGQSIHLHYGISGQASDSDSYMTANHSGEIREDHAYTGAQPYTFEADLEKRTSWYTPNQIKDRSHNANGYNEGYFNSGDQFRTSISATGREGDDTLESTLYDFE